MPASRPAFVLASVGVPLLARPHGAVLFRRPKGEVTAERFLAAARGLAAALPDAPLLNLCADRYHVALGLAAAALAGRVSLFTGERSSAWLDALAARFPGLTALTDQAATGPAGLPCFDLTAIPPAAGDFPAPCLPADRLAAIVFTSGSTGEPEGHRKSWGALAARSRDAGRRFGLTGAAVVGTVPGQHMYGLETTILLPFHAGAASWCGPAFYPVDIAAALAACPSPRVLVTTPLQLRALLTAGIALPPIRRVISATAPLDVALATAAERAWNTEIWEIFGATEVGSIASRRTVAGPEWQTYPRVRLTPAPDEAARVSAPHSAPFPLNDRVALDGPTRFHLLGRGNDLVKLGGRRASLAGLTRILTGIEGVEDGVFVAPEDLEVRPTARMLAFAVAPALRAEDILAQLRARIDPIFLPRRVVCLDRLPRDPLGKLPVRALEALRAQALGPDAVAPPALAPPTLAPQALPPRALADRPA